MWINAQGQIYIGDCREGDQEATPEEQLAWKAAEDARNKPKAVTMRQARLALLNAGMLATVDAAIAAMPGAAGDAARIEWEFSSEVRRDKALVQSLAPILNISEQQLDDLFAAAALL